jgi:predicted nucleic acid-binding protein
MRIYLDTCTLQRPFDDQSQARIKLESEATLEIISAIEQGKLELISSEVLEYELEMSKQPHRIKFVRKALELAKQTVTLTETHRTLANQYTDQGVKAIDALHLAVANETKAHFLSTYDDRFFNASKRIDNLNCNLTNPTQFVISHL